MNRLRGAVGVLVALMLLAESSWAQTITASLSDAASVAEGDGGASEPTVNLIYKFAISGTPSSNIKFTVETESIKGTATGGDRCSASSRPDYKIVTGSIETNGMQDDPDGGKFANIHVEVCGEFNDREPDETVIVKVTPPSPLPSGLVLDPNNPGTSSGYLRASGTIENDEPLLTVTASPSQMTEENLDGAVLTLTQSGEGGTEWDSDVAAEDFTLWVSHQTNPSTFLAAAVLYGLSIESVSRTSDTVVTLTLEHDAEGTGLWADFDKDFKIYVQALASGHNRRPAYETDKNNPLTVLAIDEPAALTVAFGSATYSAKEGGTAATVTVTATLASPATKPGREVVIPLTTTLQGGAVAADFSAPASLTFAADDTGTALSKTITVTAVDDSDADPGESVLLGFGTLPEGVTAGTQATTTVALTDNESDAIEFTVSASSIAENSTGSVTVIVELVIDEDALLAEDLTVPLEFGGTAVKGTDYTTSETEITFLETSGNGDVDTFTLTPTNDTVVELSETITVSTTVAGYAAVSASVTLTDDDDTAILSITGPGQDPAAHIEEGQSAEFTVTLSAAVGAPVTVAWSVPAAGSDGAEAHDFEPTSGTVTFPAGSAVGATQTIAAQSVDDPYAEGTEGFTVALGEVTGGLADKVSVSTTAGSAKGSIAKSDPDALTINFAIRTSSLPAAVEGGAPVEVVVYLSPAPDKLTPEREVVVPLVVTPQGGADASDYRVSPLSFRFRANQEREHLRRTITVTAVDDSDKDPGETVVLSFGPLPKNVFVAREPYDEVTVALEDDEGTVALEDDEGTRKLTVSFIPKPGGKPYIAIEGGAAAEVGVRLSLPPAQSTPGREVVVPLTTTLQGGAVAGDVTVSPSSVTFGANDSGADLAKTITVTAVDDSDKDPGETVVLGFGTLPHDVFVGRVATVPVWLMDDDAGVILGLHEDAEATTSTVRQVVEEEVPKPLPNAFTAFSSGVFDIDVGSATPPVTICLASASADAVVYQSHDDGPWTPLDPDVDFQAIVPTGYVCGIARQFSLFAVGAQDGVPPDVTQSAGWKRRCGRARRCR